jgi:hypothetical protein
LGYCSYRSWICSTIGAICPWSLPLVLTSTPTMTCEAVSVLSWTF